MSHSLRGENGIDDNSYKKIAELVSDLLWEWDLKTDTVRMSAGISQMFKSFTKKSHVRRWDEHIHSDERNTIKKSLQKALKEKTKTKWSAQYRFLFDDKNETWVSDTVHIQRNSKGQAVRLIGSIQDISKRKHTEEKLLNIQSQFKALYNANIIGVMYEKTNGEIIQANDAFLQMIEYTRDEFEKNKIFWSDLTPPEYELVDQKAAEQVFKSGMAYPYEKEYITKSGGRIPVIVGAVMLDPEEGKVLAFALDIKERKELEMKKDEFMSIASHELCTPLTSIKGYTQILERIIQQMGDQRLHAYLKKTNTYVDRLNSLIVELLDVSKIQAGKLIMSFESVPFDQFVEENIEALKHFSSKHTIEYHGQIDETLMIDRNRLEQVFTNLVTNAIKYSPNGKKIKIRVKKEQGLIIVSIKDDGIGISKKDQENLFNRFYRVESSSNNFSGLGIGLYISREIINRHGGDIWVKSKKGEGSEFFFSLPIKGTFPHPHVV